MSAVRTLAAGMIAGALVFLTLGAGGCGTGAVGIDKCRSIEDARCSAGVYCGIVTDVDACKRYYRDQCLHGMAHGEPSEAQLHQCVQTIQLAGDCAKKNGADAKLSSCATPPSTQTYGLATACDIVNKPQQTDECGFLSAKPPEAGPSEAGNDAGDAASDGPADAAGGAAGD